MKRNVKWNVGVTCLAELAREARFTLALEGSDAVNARSPVQALYASTIINFCQHRIYSYSNKLTMPQYECSFVKLRCKRTYVADIDFQCNHLNRYTCSR